MLFFPFTSEYNQDNSIVPVFMKIVCIYLVAHQLQRMGTFSSMTLVSVVARNSYFKLNFKAESHQWEALQLGHGVEARCQHKVNERTEVHSNPFDLDFHFRTFHDYSWRH